MYYYRYFIYLCSMENLKEKLSKIAPYLNERQRRIVYAAEAAQLGRGGKAIISRLTGMSRPTLNEGLRELSANISDRCAMNRIRAKGGGRKNVTSIQPELKSALESY